MLLRHPGSVAHQHLPAIHCGYQATAGLLTHILHAGQVQGLAPGPLQGLGNGVAGMGLGMGGQVKKLLGAMP